MNETKESAEEAYGTVRLFVVRAGIRKIQDSNLSQNGLADRPKFFH